ncbi:hypothetical protein AKJ16_DCAP14037 [Drosera capensis]
MGQLCQAHPSPQYSSTTSSSASITRRISAAAIDAEQFSAMDVVGNQFCEEKDRRQMLRVQSQRVHNLELMFKPSRLEIICAESRIYR